MWKFFLVEDDRKLASYSSWNENYPSDDAVMVCSIALSHYHSDGKYHQCACMHARSLARLPLRPPARPLAFMYE